MCKVATESTSIAVLRIWDIRNLRRIKKKKTYQSSFFRCLCIFFSTSALPWSCLWTDCYPVETALWLSSLRSTPGNCILTLWSCLHLSPFHQQEYSINSHSWNSALQISSNHTCRILWGTNLGIAAKNNLHNFR